jgi:hypothetical protein
VYNPELKETHMPRYVDILSTHASILRLSVAAVGMFWLAGCAPETIATHTPDPDQAPTSEAPIDIACDVFPTAYEGQSILPESWMELQPGGALTIGTVRMEYQLIISRDDSLYQRIDVWLVDRKGETRPVSSFDMESDTFVPLAIRPEGTQFSSTLYLYDCGGRKWASVMPGPAIQELPIPSFN